MDKHKIVSNLAIAVFSLALGSSLLINHNLEKHYFVGDFIPEENAYYGGEITDPAGLVKAHKYVIPTDNKYSSQKTRSLGSGLIGNIEGVWSTYTGAGTTVAIIDDGFDVDHPEFTRSNGTSAILSTSRYYYSNKYGTAIYYKDYSSEPDCILEDWESDGEGGYEWATHGTNTSTTAAAPMGNGGGVGIAPDADILALKIDFSLASIKGAIQYAISQGVDVINMSLGAYAESFTDGWGVSQTGYTSTATYLDEACQEAYDAGIIVVAAAGNESTWHKSYPACNTKVIGVGAIGDWDNKGNATKLAEFTNYVLTSQTGEINVDILAPGYVYTAKQTTSSGTNTSSSTTPSSHTHSYGDTQGTSFSSPIVAGAACLWKQKYPNGTPDEFLEQLQASADGIGTYKNKMIPVSGWDEDLNDVGPSNIENGRLNVANLMSIDDPFVDTVQSSLSIVIGENKQINLNAYNGSITYSSADTSVATVSDTGLVTGTGAGDTTITVTASKNGFTATTSVGVHVDEVIECSSLSANPSSFSIEIGGNYNIEPTLTIEPSNASRYFLYESGNESIATVDIYTGVVTGVMAGKTTITVLAAYGDGEVEIDVEVTGSSVPTSWDKVTSTSDITNGDYLIVYSNGGKAFNGALTTLDAVSNTIAVTISNNSIAYDDATAAAKFTINAVSGGYSIRAASGKYIGNGSNANALTSSDTSLLNTISITSGGDANIIGSGGAYLRYNNDVNQARFRYFKSSSYSSQQAIQLFKANAGSSTPATPTVSDVTVSPESLSLDLNNNTTGNLSATVTGTNSPSLNVTWSTGNDKVATVSPDGVVTAVGKGKTTITATSVLDSTKSGSCTVTVTDTTPAPKTLSSISISGYTTSLEVNSSFVFGGTVMANFDNYPSEDVTSSASFSGYNMAVAGEYTVTVSYIYSSTTKTATYKLTVTETSSATMTATYTIGWGSATGTTGTFTNFTSTSGSVTDVLSFTTDQNSSSNAPFYSSGSNELRLYFNSSGKGGSITITPAEGITFTGFVMTTSSSPNVKYSVDGGSATSVSCSSNTYTVEDISASESIKIQNVNTSNTMLKIKSIALTYEVPDESDKVIESLTATYSGGDVFVGDSLDESKVSVTASYDEGLYEDAILNSDEYEISGFTSATAGEKTVTVTYTGSCTTKTNPMTTTFVVNVITDSVTSVVATCSKSYHPGEKIVKSDITVTLHFASGKQETTTDFTFADDNYMFTYSDAPSGGTAGTKQFSITYGTTVANFNVNVSRVANQTINESTTILSSSQFNSSNLSKNSGTASPTSVTIGGVAFTVTSNAYAFTTDNKYYLSFGKGIGSIINTNAFVSDLISVSVTQKSGARQDGVLSISKDGSTWVTFNGGSITDSGYRYFKYEYTSASTASGASAYSNLQTISFTLSGQDNAVNVANYIMYEDITNQCTTKLDLAITKLNSMSSAEKTLFWTSEDYVISTARERLVAWATNQGKTIDLQNDTFKVNTNGLSMFQGLSSIDNKVIPIVGIISLISLASIGGYFFIKKREE